jgi:hypothetical protein
MQGCQLLLGCLALLQAQAGVANEGMDVGVPRVPA